MSANEDEQTSHEHDDSTYAVAVPDPEHVDDNMMNPPPGPSVEQTRGVPTEGATRAAPAKRGAKKEEDS